MKIHGKFVADQERTQLDPNILERFYRLDQREELRQMARQLLEQLAEQFGCLRAENPEAAALILRCLKKASSGESVGINPCISK